jgi:hypothetical protein
MFLDHRLKIFLSSGGAERSVTAFEIFRSAGAPVFGCSCGYKHSAPPELAQSDGSTMLPKPVAPMLGPRTQEQDYLFQGFGKWVKEPPNAKQRVTNLKCQAWEPS